MDRDLHVAILTLKRGNPIPLDLAFRLMSKGYDVAEIEAKYSTND